MTLHSNLSPESKPLDPLEILYLDDDLVAVNKPHGLLVHRSKIATNTDTFALQLLRDQLDMHVYPTHRLDRKTSGVLLFALNKKTLSAIGELFERNEMKKTYWCILRGFSASEGFIDYPLTNDKGKTQQARTAYVTLDQTEINLPFGHHTTSRYSWVEAKPETGRMHQLRKHFAHIFHPIIGDRPHGCNKQNKLFLEKWNMSTMLLHAVDLCFEHPSSKQKIQITAKPQSEFTRMVETLNFKKQLLG